MTPNFQISAVLKPLRLFSSGRPAAFEALARCFPYLPLADLPTPVHRLEQLSKRLGSELWVKRDDLTASSYGGNHVRKFELLFPDALRMGARRILTFGGVGSNFVVALAAHASRAGLECEAILVDQPATCQVRKNLLLAHHFGARLHYARTFPGAALTFLKRYAQITRQDRTRPYALRPGGASVLGALGHALAGVEWCEQIRQGLCPKPDRLFVTVGSCGTLAGLLAGMAWAGLEVPVAGVRVVERYIVNRTHIRWLARRILARLVQAAAPARPPVLPRFELVHEFFGGEYGNPTRAGVEALELARREAGLELDTTYTGKTFAALLDWGRRPENRGRRALFWHTYSSADCQALLQRADWHALPPVYWKFFDGSLPLAKPARTA